MKLINNKKGSAILWTILLTVILTILLGAISTAAYAYFNYTLYTVRRQQAYFTARSAMSTILEQYTTIDLEHQSDDGSNIYSYDTSINPLLPAKGEKIKVNNFGFDNMGTATAEIEVNSKDSDMIDVVVNSTYAGEDYTMKATVARQPIYFGGVAIKNLALGPNSKFELEKGTDFYYYTYKNKEAMGTNKANTFDTSAICKNGASITIHGNVITQGDAKLDNHIVAAGYHFNTPVEFSNKVGGHSRKIWNSEQYIISNRTFTIDENIGKYTTSIANVFTSLTNTSLYYCNNAKSTMNNCFGRSSLFNLTNTSDSGGLKIFNEMLSWLQEIGGQTELGRFSGENTVDNLAVKDTNNNALSTRYIEILSLSNTLNNSVDYINNMIKNNSGILGNIAASAFKSMYDNTVGGFLDKYGLTVMDISYIDFDSTNQGNFGDSGATPVTYLFVEGNAKDGLYVRVKYGSKPDSTSLWYRASDWINNGIDSIAENWLKILKQTSYVIVYLGENSTIELGVSNPGILALSEPAKTEANQKYFMSIYGQPGSKVILNDKVQLIGEVMADNLTINGDVKITYASSNGSQVAKQKVAEYWTVVNYSD